MILSQKKQKNKKKNLQMSKSKTTLFREKKKLKNLQYDYHSKTTVFRDDLCSKTSLI